MMGQTPSNPEKLAVLRRLDVGGPEKTADQLIEEGVGLIAKGMFRMGHKDAGNDPKAASDAGMSAVSVIREMAFEFMRKAGV